MSNSISCWMESWRSPSLTLPGEVRRVQSSASVWGMSDSKMLQGPLAKGQPVERAQVQAGFPNIKTSSHETVLSCLSCKHCFIREALSREAWPVSKIKVLLLEDFWRAYRDKLLTSNAYRSPEWSRRQEMWRAQAQCCLPAASPARES